MNNKVTDLVLVSRVVLFDDRRAFDRLVGRHQSAVRRFLLNLTQGDRMLCDDLAQETFIKAYLNMKSFQGMAAFSTWLYRIAYNQYYDHIKVRKNRMGEHIDLRNVVSEGYAPALAQDLQMDLQDALNHLRSEERSVLLLFYMEDQSVKEIAKIMNAPEGTIKSLLSRGRSNLETYLKQDHYEK